MRLRKRTSLPLAALLFTICVASCGGAAPPPPPPPPLSMVDVPTRCFRIVGCAAGVSRFRLDDVTSAYDTDDPLQIEVSGGVDSRFPPVVRKVHQILRQKPAPLEFHAAAPCDEGYVELTLSATAGDRRFNFFVNRRCRD